MRRFSLPRRIALGVGMMAVAACGERGPSASAARTGPRTAFNGEAALGYVRDVMAFGPRVPGTEGHRRAGEWITAQMQQRADTVVLQEWTHRTAAGDSLPMRNVLARFRPAAAERV